jgi:hypothetical protein
VDDGVSVGVVKGVNVKREEVVVVREDMVEGMASKICEFLLGDLHAIWRLNELNRLRALMNSLKLRT